MTKGKQSLLYKALFLLTAYAMHGCPFAGLPDYGYALVVAYLLLFGIKREHVKRVFVVSGLGLLMVGKFIPQLAISEQQRILMDSSQRLITPGDFLSHEEKYLCFQTADGYLQGYVNRRLVNSIDIDVSILSLRSGWVNRGEYNFYSPISPYFRGNLPFVVRYEIIPQLVGMSLNLEGLMIFEKNHKVRVHDPAVRSLLIEPHHVGYTLCGFGGQWDDKGFNYLKIKLEKNTLYKFYDISRMVCFYLGAIFLFLGLFTLEFTLSLVIQSALIICSAIIFWYEFHGVFRWGIMAAGGGDGIIHGGMPYWMLEKWSAGKWGEALMSQEKVFYYMPGMRYVRFLEMLLFGDAYIFQVCLLLFVPVIFYRFFAIFLNTYTALCLTVLNFAYFGDRAGMSFKLYIKSTLFLHGETVSYSLLFIALIILARSVKNIGWGAMAFFLLSISFAIRPNLAFFIGILMATQVFSTTFCSLPLKDRLMTVFGFIPVLLIPLHNILGGEFVLLTKASQVPENLSLSPHLYYEGLLHILGYNQAFNAASHFTRHFNMVSPQYIIAWLGCLWVIFKGKPAISRAFSLAAFAGLSMHLFYIPGNRYIHPYLTVSIIMVLAQFSSFRAVKLQTGIA